MFDSTKTPLTMHRRRFLQLGLGALALPGLPGVRAAAGGATDVVAVIHTTDLHGNVLPTSDYDGNADLGGLARCATRIAGWRERFPASLLVDAGDLYQGTEVGFRTRGRIMTDCLNHLGYDAWVLGNHEFDWGVEAVHEAAGHSTMPVLAANGEFDGHRAWEEAAREHSRVAPYVIREAGGYRIALVGMTTPGMPNWFLPELLGGFHAHDPLPVFEKVLREVEAQRPDAIILVTHMGGRPGAFRDDEANRVAGLAQMCRRADGTPRVAAIIAGHTHQSMPSEEVFGTPYTQAGYFGIYLGRLELVFDRETRRLVAVQPHSERMDSAVALDPAIITLCRDRLDEAEAHLDEPAGVLADELSHQRRGANPTDIERLIGRSISDGLAAHGVEADGVIHGMLFTNAPWPAGPKTVRNIWEIIPFENFIVTAEITLEALKAVAAEAWASRRALLGLEATFEGRGRETRCVSIKGPDGRELEASRRFRIAVNSYDAAGGGGRLETLRRVMDEPENRRTLHQLQSRALLADLLRKHQPLTLDFLMGRG
jgi:2',3'-cyclic-nucleotide 2'-phosphodiesterase/3'-nucleotidase